MWPRVGPIDCKDERRVMRVTGVTVIRQDWVKAIGKKLREDLGDCPTLPQELVDALGKLESAEHTSNRNTQTLVAKAGATPERGMKDRAIRGASGS